MRYLLLFLAIVLAAPFAQAQKPNDADKPDDAEGLLGTWEYTVRPDDPMAQGTFVLEDADSQINGTFNTNEPRKMENIQLTETTLSFSFTQPGMGTINISMTLADGSLAGEALPEDEDEPIEIVAVRPGADSDISED